jgi:hypothetical protein
VPSLKRNKHLRCAVIWMHRSLPLCVSWCNALKVWAFIRSISCSRSSSWNPGQIPSKLHVCLLSLCPNRICIVLLSSSSF